MKECFNGATIYQLLIFLLITKGKSNEKKYIFSELFPKSILEKIASKIVISENFVFAKNKLIKGILFIVYLIQIKMSLGFGKLKKMKLYKIYGESLFSDLLINKKIPVYILEDGLKNYSKNAIEKNVLENFLIKLFWRIEFKSEMKKAKKIYLTGLAPIPKEIAHKVEIINLKELWNKKTLEEQNDILDVFSFDLDIKEKIKGRDIILFTQPLSEDNVITEEEKLKIYSEIIKKYPKDRLVIKTHPREKTNYKDIFKEYLVLDNPFPFEILNLLDVKFNKAITLFSTAALGLGDRVKVDFYGTEVHDKILKRFGSCDNIMERNCFLKEE